MLKDFTLDFVEYDSTKKNTKDIKFLEQDDHENKAGDVITFDDINIEDAMPEEIIEGMDFINYLVDEGCIISYKEYRNQRINDIFE